MTGEYRITTLFLLSGLSSAWAIQEIPLDQAIKVLRRMEVRFTYNTNSGSPYIWGRFISPSGWWKWHYCYLFSIASEADFRRDLLALGASGMEGTHYVLNPHNGLWFVTNAKNIEQNPADMAWCTQ